MNDTCVKDRDEQCFHDCTGCPKGNPVQAKERTVYCPFDWMKEEDKDE